MTQDPLYDVAVVGFGPSGAVAAAMLGQAGLRVLVLDKSRTVYDKPRAVAMDHEIMRLLQGIGVAQAVLPHTEPFSASEHFGAQGQMIRRLAMLDPPYPLGWTPSMVFLQPPVEQIVRDRVAALPGVDVQLGVELVGLAQDAASVSLQLRDNDGSTRAANDGSTSATTDGSTSAADHGATRTAQARYLVGCDGASSTVRRLAGMAMDDLDFDEPWLVIDVQANARGLAKLPRASAQFCEPGRPASFIIGTGSHRRWEIMLLPGEDPRDMERDEQVWKLLARWITPDDATLWRRAAYRFHALVARDWRRGRVFLAGDAAHQQPPFLGQGMCQGLRDVANLAWKLQQVLAGTAGDDLLASYGEERSAHVRQLTTTIKHIGHTICERDPAAAQARDARLLAEAGGSVKTVPRQDLVPGLQAGLLSPRAHAARGSLFPQPRVLQDGQARLLDDAAGTGWRLVCADAARAWSMEPLPASPAGMQLLRFADTPVAGCWQETEGVLEAWFARHACSAAIVRPDHYVYAVADSEPALRAELASLAAALQPTPAPTATPRRPA